MVKFSLIATKEYLAHNKLKQDMVFLSYCVMASRFNARQLLCSCLTLWEHSYLLG
jgi:hypothetical protein